MLCVDKEEITDKNKISEKSLPGDTIPEAIYFSMIKTRSR